jgi:hypothetical protein
MEIRVFENKVWRRIFGSKREEVTGTWRELCNEKLYNLYSSDQTRRMG